MQPKNQILQDDQPIAPIDAHEVLIDVTGGNQAVPDDDASETSRESLPRDAEEVSESGSTAERLQSHASEQSPPADVPGRHTEPD